MRVISMQSSAGTLALDGTQGVQAKLDVRGTGLPDLSTQWFEGAGDGATFRASRVLPRVLDVPVKVTGQSRADVEAAFSLLAKIVAPNAGPVRLSIMVDGVEWYVLAYRTGGGDWSWAKDTDGQTMVTTVLTMRAGDPYWLRANEESRVIQPGGVGRGLLRGPGALQGLEVSSTQGLGQVQFTNAGDVDAYPTWTLVAPFSSFTLTGPDGRALVYEAAKATGHIVIDTELGTVVDETGANQYANLGAAPQFWRIPPGLSQAELEVEDAVGGQTEARVFWRPRKWLVF